MNARTLLLVASSLGSLFVAAPAHAGFVGLTVSEVTTALDGVTPLTEIFAFPGGIRVIEVYAQFDSPTDQAVGVVGSPDHPFNVMTLGGSSFINTGPPFGSDKAPISGFDFPDPTLHWDSFYTIGLRLVGALGEPFPSTPQVELIVVPGTPGPNNPMWGGGHTNMGWVLPPSIDGVPLAETVAGNFDYDLDGEADNKVLLMRLVVARGEHIEGTFGVLATAPDGMIEAMPASFTTLTIPAPGALALLALAGLAGPHRRRTMPRAMREPEPKDIYS